MASPDPEGALEDETATQPGARAGLACRGEEERFRQMAGQSGEEPGDEPIGGTERPVDPRGIGRERAGRDRVRGEDRAPYRGTDALARDVAREPGGVADEREAGPRDPARAPAPDRVRVAAERRQRE